MKPIKNLKWGLIPLLIFVFFFTAWTSYQRLGAFGCSDQCFNFVAAHFMLKGKALYSEIFFNHQPLMAYLSYLIQLFLRPSNLYQLVLYHRIFIILFSFLMGILILWRFRWVGTGFILFYELTKFYLYGQFFHPEAMVVYLLVYLLGLWWKKYHQERLFLADYLLAGLFTWLIVFLRIPYLPVALAIYFFFLWPFNQKNKKLINYSLFIFFFFSLLLLLNLPLKEYLTDLLIVNYRFASSETQGTGLGGLGIMKIFLYPFLILLKGKAGYFRTVLIGLDLVFLSLIVYQGLRLKKIKTSLIILFFLGLAAIRFVEPGTMFYEAFHLAPWYGLFLMAIFLLLSKLSHQKLRFGLNLVLVITFSYALFSPWSFLWEKVDQQEEFTIEYADYFAYGTVIKTLAKPEQTVFLELWDDLIYWQASLDSAYPFSLYTPAMLQLEKFSQAREKMFQTNPPDFYYSYPGASKDCSPLFPEELKAAYLQLYFSEKPTCLYLKKENLPEITNQQWQTVKDLGFHLPKVN